MARPGHRRFLEVQPVAQEGAYPTLRPLATGGVGLVNVGRPVSAGRNGIWFVIWDGTRWRAPSPVSRPEAPPGYEPDLLISSREYLVAWSADADGNPFTHELLFASVSRDEGHRWSKATLIDSAGHIEDVRLVASHGGNPGVVYLRRDTAHATGTIHYAISGYWHSRTQRLIDRNDVTSVDVAMDTAAGIRLFFGTSSRADRANVIVWRTRIAYDCKVTSIH